jgi:uncharacterized damage-inducible protein DinB
MPPSVPCQQAPDTLDKNTRSPILFKKGGTDLFMSIQDVVTEWKRESAQTETIMAALTDESLSQEIAPGHRTIGRLAWHIVHTIHEMMTAAGLQFMAPGEGPPPASAADILAAYRTANKAFLDALQAQWKDATLAELRPMYGEEWTGAVVLAVLIKHEIHHRAQVTVLMRQAGLPVPGLYGPAKEDWAVFGAEPPAV